MTEVRVTSDSRGFGHVTVDGHDISHGVRGVTVRIAAGSIPRVEVDLSTFDVQGDVDGEVMIPDGTRDALIQLGWKAPRMATITDASGGA